MRSLMTRFHHRGWPVVYGPALFDRRSLRRVAAGIIEGPRAVTVNDRDRDPDKTAGWPRDWRLTDAAAPGRAAACAGVHTEVEGHLLLLGGRASSLLAGPVMPRDGSGVGR